MNNIKIDKTLQFVCETLDMVIDNEQERIWVDARLNKDIEDGVDQVAIARELADEYRIEIPKEQWAVFA